MTEIEQVIETKSISEQTKTNYKRQYNKILTGLGVKSIQSITEENLIKYVKGSSENVGSQAQYLNIIIMIKKYFNKPFDKLVEFQTELHELRTKHTKELIQSKKEELPTFETLKKYLSSLKNNNDYRGFIVNYLLMTYGLRNQDINVFITDDKTRVVDDRNFIIVKKTECELLINNYKTLTTYGNKKIIIKSRVFIEFCNKLLNTYLLNKTDGITPVADSSIGKIIPRFLYDNLTESDYFKILVRHIQNTGKNVLGEIKKLSAYRGTNVDTIIEYYNIKV
jgi:hypothetical protein